MYKFVRAWSRRTLEKAGESVMDVAADDDEDESIDESTRGPDTSTAGTAGSAKAL